MHKHINYFIIPAILTLQACASASQLPFFHEVNGGISEDSWWQGGLAPQNIQIALPTDINKTWSYFSLPANFRDLPMDGVVMSQLNFKRFSFAATPRLSLDASPYIATHPGYSLMIRSPAARPPSIEPVATYDVFARNMLLEKFRMQFLGGTKESIKDDISPIPSPRLSGAQLLSAEPKGDYVLDHGPEIFKLTADGHVIFQMRFRMVERQTAGFVVDHTCTGKTVRPLTEKELKDTKASRFIQGLSTNVDRICTEAAKRSLIHNKKY